MSNTAVNFQRPPLYKHGPKLWLLSLCLDPNSLWNCSDVSECAVNIFHAQITFINTPVTRGKVPLVHSCADCIKQIHSQRTPVHTVAPPLPWNPHPTSEMILHKQLSVPLSEMERCKSDTFILCN